LFLVIVNLWETDRFKLRNKKIICLLTQLSWESRKCLYNFTYHEKRKHATDSCLWGEALWSSSWEQMHMHPPRKLAITWARTRIPAAANPSLKASSLGSLHSNIQSLRCLTCINTHPHAHIIDYNKIYSYFWSIRSR
jgi:hypothetical protein